MKLVLESNVRFMPSATAFLVHSNKQTTMMNRYRSIERPAQSLFRFGYLVYQFCRVCRGGAGYDHVLVLSPWKKGVHPAEPCGAYGITIGTTIITEYDDQTPTQFEPAHEDGRAELIYTPPFDYKTFLPPVREALFSFPGLSDGSIDFSSVMVEP